MYGPGLVPVFQKFPAGSVRLTAAKKGRGYDLGGGGDRLHYYTVIKPSA